MSEVQNIRPLGSGLGPGLGPLERAQIQGPWGSAGGGKFFDVGTSINRMKLTYHSPGMLGSMEMDYEFAGRKLVRRCNGNVYGDQYEEVSYIHIVSHEFHVSYSLFELIFWKKKSSSPFMSS